MLHLQDWEWATKELGMSTREWGLLLQMDASLVSRVRRGQRNLPAMAEAHFSQAIRILATLPGQNFDSETPPPDAREVKKLEVKTRQQLHRVEKELTKATQLRKQALTRLAWLQALMAEPDPPQRPLGPFSLHCQRKANLWITQNSPEKIAFLQWRQEILQYTLALCQELKK